MSYKHFNNLFVKFLNSSITVAILKLLLLLSVKQQLLPPFKSLTKETEILLETWKSQRIQKNKDVSNMKEKLSKVNVKNS